MDPGHLDSLVDVAGYVACVREVQHELAATRLWRRAAASATRVKREGWREQGVLVVSPDDERLSWPERELVRQLAEKLYGPRPEARR